MKIISSKFYSRNPNNDLYIAPRGDRWYEVPHWWAVDVFTDCGRIHAESEPSFFFDGRSGGVCVDLVVPNLGTQTESKEWLKHDLFGHGLILNFTETNDMLRIGLRDNCGYLRSTAGAIHKAVSISDDWFGEPTVGDRSFPNMRLITVRHYDK